MDPENKPEYKTEEQERQEEISVPGEGVSLPIDDNDLVSIIDKRIRDDEMFYRSVLKLDKRTKDMEDFYLGKQFDESQFAIWQVPYKDNIIWQDLEHRIATAAGRMPDIIVTPAEDSPEKKEKARTFEKILDIKVKNDVTKRLVKDGLRNLHISLRAAIKVRWDKNRGPNGDFVFELVRPHRVGVEHTSTIPHDGFTSDNMELIYEWIEEPVGLILSKFPDKKDALFQALGIVRGTTRQMASKIKYLECWFTWYDKEGKVYEGVCWKYRTLILRKQKNPFFDWDGYEVASQETSEDGTPKVDTVYRNHFDRPRKPYIWFSYTNLGRSPYDDTSAVEQAIPLQRIVNKRGRQITEISDRAVPKLAFSGRYITKEQARRVTNDPDEHIWVEQAEDVRQAVQHIPANNPSPILFNDLVSNRNQIDSKFSTHGTSRGEVRSQESGISKQITREGDLVTSDDIVAIVVERVIYEMANWATQIMKINYDKPHFIKDAGREGEGVFEEITQDSIDDGIAVNVKASSVDKQTRRADALELAGRKGTDPFSMYEDLDHSNPKERTKRLVTFLSGEADGYARYMEAVGLMGDGSDTETRAPGAGADQALQDIEQLKAGQDVEPSGVPSPEYVQAFMQFVQGGGLDQLPPEVQQLFAGYIEKIKGIVNSQMED